MSGNKAFKQAFKSGIFIMVLYVLSSGIGYLTRVLMARYMPTDQFGLFFGILTLLMSFSILCDLSFGQVIQVTLPKLILKGSTRKIKEYLMTFALWQFAMRLLLTLGFVLTARYLALQFFHVADIQGIIVILAFAFFLNAFGVFAVGLISYGKFGTVAVMNFLRVTLFLAFLYLFSLHALTLTLCAWAYVISMVLMDVSTVFLFLRQAMPDLLRPIVLPRLSILKELFVIGIPFTLASLGLYVHGILDTLSIAHLRPAFELGIYQMVLPTAMFLGTLFLSPVVLMLPTLLAKAKTKAEQREFVKTLSNTAIYVFLPILAFIIIFAGAILELLFHVSDPFAVMLLRLIFVNQLLLVMVQIRMTTFVGLKRPGESLKTSIVMGASLAVLTPLLTSFFGIYGTIAAYFLAYAVFLAMTERLLHRLIRLTFSWKSFAKILLAAAPAALGMYIISLVLPAIIAMALAFVCGMFIYLGMSSLFAIQEKRFLFALVRDEARKLFNRKAAHK